MFKLANEKRTGVTIIQRCSAVIFEDTQLLVVFFFKTSQMDFKFNKQRQKYLRLRIFIK